MDGWKNYNIFALPGPCGSPVAKWKGYAPVAKHEASV